MATVVYGCRRPSVALRTPRGVMCLCIAGGLLDAGRRLAEMDRGGEMGKAAHGPLKVVSFVAGEHAEPVVPPGGARAGGPGGVEGGEAGVGSGHNRLVLARFRYAGELAMPMPTRLCLGMAPRDTARRFDETALFCWRFASRGSAPDRASVSRPGAGASRRPRKACRWSAGVARCARGGAVRKDGRCGTQRGVVWPASVGRLAGAGDVTQTGFFNNAARCW